MLETFFSKINKSEVVATKRKDVQEIHEYLEDFDEENVFFKKLILLGHDPIWYRFILVTGLFNMLYSITAATLTIYNSKYRVDIPDTFYIVDICWGMDICVRLLSNHKKVVRSSLLATPHVCVYQIAIQIAGVFPIEIMAYQHNTIHNFLMLNRQLKIVHVISMFSFMESKIHCGITSKIMQLIYLLVWISGLGTLTLVYIKCNHDMSVCKTDHFFDNVVRMVRITSGIVTTHGFGLHSFEHNVAKFALVCISYFTFTAVTTLFTALITFSLSEYATHKGTFRYKFNVIASYLSSKGMSSEYIDYVHKYYDKMWIYCCGYEGYMAEINRPYAGDAFKTALPRAMLIEIQTDVFWGAFSHSSLFKDLDIPFLKELAVVMKQIVYISGQYVFHQNQIKDKMIYIFSGVIQLISEEDGETPLIHLADGTCLGETALLLPYKSKFKTRCLNTCLLQVLDRQDFLKISKKYPHVYRKLIKTVLVRYSDSKNLHSTKYIVNDKCDHLIRGSLSTMWINFTLHKLMGTKDMDSAHNHAVQNIYLQDIITNKTFQFCLFSAQYLSMYAITERTKANTDTLFIKSTFPYIFKPKTGLTLFWDLIISMFALGNGIYLPIICLVDRGTYVSFYFWVYTITSLWWMDNLVNLRTAIKLKHRIITNPYEIWTHRLFSVIFLIDLVSSIPIEIISPMLVNKNNKELIFMNRFLKVLRIFQLLGKWERRYNSNPITVRFLYIAIVLLLSINFSACLYYYQGCTGVCNLEWIEFYSLQIISGVSLWVEGYSNEMNFDMLNIFMFTLMSIGCVVLYGLTFSSRAFNHSHLLKVKGKTMKFVNVMMTIEKKLIARILVYVKTETLTLNRLHIYQRNYIFNSLPKPLLGHLFENIYIDWIINLPMFAGLPVYVIIDILQEAAASRILSANVPLYFVGDLLQEILILSQGQIEVVCGTNLEVKVIYDKEAINDIEIFLDIPCRNSTRTITNCELIFINFMKMKKVLLKYENGLSIKPFPSVRDIRTKILNIPIHQTQNESYVDSELKLNFDNKKRPNYISAFKKEGYLILCCFLQPITLHPEGTCFFMLEVVRAICSIASAFLFPTTGLIFFKISHPIKIILIILDVLAFLDIYIRLHVCYYDTRGILITHPFYTARHYFQNSFWIDLLAAFPLQAFIKTNRLILLNAFKVLQIYRYFGFFNWLQIRNVKPLPRIIKHMYLPIFMIFTNIGASILVTINCDIVFEDGQEKNIDCNKYSILTFNRMQWDISATRLHLYAFYILVSTVTRSAIQGFKIANTKNMYIIAVFSIIALFWNVVISNNNYAFCTMEYMSLIRKDLDRSNFIKFMKMYKIPKIYLTYVEAFMYRLSYMKKYDVHSVMDTFPTTMQRECLFERYGRSLVKMCLIYSTDFHPFIRNCLLHTRYLIFEKNGYVLTINDIVGETMFLFSGIIEVVRSDGTVLALLKPGSIIGNLCEIKYNRMQYTIIASCTVEILALKTVKFQQILKHFPGTKKEFRILQSIHGSHIPGYSTFTYNPESHKKQLNFIFLRRTLTIYVCSLILQVIGSFLSVLFYFYQVSVSDFSVQLFKLNIVTDIMYIALLVLRITMQMEDEFGLRNKVGQIIYKLVSNRSNYISLLAAIPFEYVLFGFTLNSRTYYYSFICLRSHVLLRMYFIYDRISQNDHRHRKRILVSQMTLAYMCLIFFIVGCTAVLMGLSEVKNQNMNDFINREKLLYGTSEYRLNEFIKWLFVVACSYTKTSQISYYPIDGFYVMLLTVMMILMEISLADIRADIIAMVQIYGLHKYEYKQKLSHLVSYLNTYETSQSLVDRVSYYTSMMWKKMKGTKYPLLLDMIPAYLKDAILYAAISSTVECHPVFGKCHFDLKRQLISKMKFEYYYFGDYIQYKGIVDNTMYWVVTGEIVCLSEKSSYRDDIIKTLKAGDAFGIPQGIFTNVPHMVSYRSVSHTCVVFLEKSDWDYLMIFFPGSRKIIYEEAEKIQFAEENFKKHFEENSTINIDENEFHSSQ